MKAVIIHGSFGSPHGNWFPWLGAALQSRGFEVKIPAFPTPESQNLSNWLYVAQEELADFVDGDTVLIGHSIGATFLLSFLEKLAAPVKATALISPVFGTIENADYDTVNQPFFEKPFDWEKIGSTMGEGLIFHGDNDPYVPLNHAEEIAEHLEIPLNVIIDGGHLNAESGYTNFPILLEAITA